MEGYTVEQAAAILGLHVKTVRNYVRDGRLKAVRIGKRYRIGRADLEAFTGVPSAPAGRHAEVSSIVRVEGIGRTELDRLGTLVTAALGGGPTGVRAELVYDEERGMVQIIVLGDLEGTAQVLRLVHALVGE